MQNNIQNSIKLATAAETLTANNASGSEAGFWTGWGVGGYRNGNPYSSKKGNRIDVYPSGATGAGIFFERAFIHYHLSGSGLSPEDLRISNGPQMLGAAIISVNKDGEVTGCND